MLDPDTARRHDGCARQPVHDAATAGAAAGASTEPYRLALPLARWQASRPAVAITIAFTLLLVLYGVIVSIAASTAPKPAFEGDDSLLYRRIIEQVNAGQSYYPVVVDEHRQHRYPLRPFVTVRLPTLAVALAALPDESTRRGAIGLLGALTLGAWAWRLRALRLDLGQYGAALLLVGLGIGPVLIPTVYTFHEAWVGLLIALSLALYGSRIWWLSVTLGLMAALVREHAAAYLLAMLILALRDRHWREAGGWGAAITLWVLALAMHAAAVHALVQPSNLASPGWAAANGWPFALRLASWNLVARAGPWVVPVLLPLSLLGLAMLRCDLGDRVALTVASFVLAFMILGRDDNTYWGLLIAPLWPVGLVFAPAAIATLLRNAAAPSSAAGAGPATFTP